MFIHARTDRGGPRPGPYHVISLTPPRSVSGRFLDGETGAKLNECSSRKTFGEDIGILGCRRNMQNADFTNLYFVADEVDVNLNVFCTPMLNRVDRQVDSGYIVAINDCRPVNGAMQFL
jgi:hypothetical protein